MNFSLKNMFYDWDIVQLIISFVIIVLLALSPLFIDSPYYLGILILTTLYMFMGITWNIVAGFAGQLLIAHIIFVATGSFASIVLYVQFGINPWIGLILAGLISMLLGYLVALVTLRYGLKMDYFALFTIALMVAMRALFKKTKLFGGAQGLGLDLSNPSFGSMIFDNKEPYLYLALALAILGIIAQFWIFRTKMGKYFMAIREEESAAAALGVNTSLYKTYALLISSFMAGVGGGLYSIYVTFVDPAQYFDLGLNVEMIMSGPIIGGLGSLAGPVVGAVINKPLAELLRGSLADGRSGTNLIIYGSFLILSVLFMPQGLTGVLRSGYQKLIKRNRGN